MLAFVLVLGLLMGLVAYNPAQAAHATCTWKPFADSPANHEFSSWCVADFKQDGAGPGDYHCQSVPEVIIADYGRLRKNIFEWKTPCGTGGYARAANYLGCQAEFWALCLGKECRWMNYVDDCEWPTPFNDSVVPKSIELWVYDPSERK